MANQPEKFKDRNHPRRNTDFLRLESTSQKVMIPQKASFEILKLAFIRLSKLNAVRVKGEMLMSQHSRLHVLCFCCLKAIAKGGLLTHN